MKTKKELLSTATIVLLVLQTMISPVFGSWTTSSTNERRSNRLYDSRDQLQLQPGFKNEDDAWLVSSPMFEQLSTGLQTYLLRKYGIMKGEPKPPHVPVEPADVTSSVAEAVAGTNKKVNDPMFDTGERMQNETSSAASGPDILIGYNNVYDLFSISGTAVSYSNDGGETWKQTLIPTLPLGQNCCDPVVAAAPGRTFYFAGLSFTQAGISTVSVTKSTDGGATWSRPSDAATTAKNSSEALDKPWMTADNTSSPHKGNVYVGWTHFKRDRSYIEVARSTDGGRTWSAPRAISSTGINQSVQGLQLDVGPNGEVYAAWTDIRLSALRIARSSDGGLTFSTPVTVLRNSLLRTFNSLLNGSFRVIAIPSLAVDKSAGPRRGNVYLVVNLPSLSPATDQLDIFLVRSSDGGRTWSEAVRLNDDMTDTDQWMPSVAVAGNGAVGVLWYDRRNDPTNNVLIDTYLAISTDGGTSFAPNQRVTTGNWMLLPAPTFLRTTFHGDYNQISATTDQFILNWADDRSGMDSDIYARVVPAVPNRTADFIVSAGTLLQNIRPSEAASFVINITSVEGFSESVRLQAAPDATGMSFSFRANRSSRGGKLILTVQTLINTPPGAYTITVVGTAAGQSRTTNLRLGVYPGAGIQQPPTLASPTRVNGFEPELAVDPSGGLVAVWTSLRFSDGSSDILLARSSDGGRTFSTPVRVSKATSVAASEPEIAIDRQGMINVIWSQFDLQRGIQDVFMARSADGGQSFSDPVNVSAINNTQSIAAEPALEVDKDGNAFAVWTRIILSSGNQDIFYAASTDGGRRFSSPTNVSAASQGQTFSAGPSIAVDASGAINIIYVQFAVATFFQDVFLIRSTDGGKTFSRPKNVSTILQTEAYAASTAFALDGSGNLAVIWIGVDEVRSEADVYFARSTDRGSTFSSAVNVSKTNAFGGTILSGGSVVIDSEGTILVVWNDATLGNYEVFISRSSDGGKTFSPAINLSSNQGLSAATRSVARTLLSQPPTIISMGNRQVAIAWDDDTAGVNRIFTVIGSSN